MTRLRHQEEAIVYARMVSGASNEVRTLSYGDKVTHNPLEHRSVASEIKDIQHQLSVILNVLASIVGVGAAVFVLAKWWEMPWRVLLAFGSAIATAAVEGAIFWLWSRRIGMQ